MLSYDPKTDLRFYPMPNMARFGVNEYQENLYRIIWSETRRSLAGEYPFTSYAWLPTYTHIQPGAWVLERWLSADDFAKCTKAYWDENLLVLGPWPARGEYEHAHTFEACGPVDANLDKLISWIEAGRKASYQDNLDACRNKYEAQERATRSTQDAMIRDAMSYKLDFAMSGAHGSRGTKTAPMRYSANQVNFGGRRVPLGNNKLISGKV